MIIFKLENKQIQTAQNDSYGQNERETTIFWEGGGGINEQFALDVTLNLSGGKLKISPKKIAQNRTSVAKGRQYTVDRTSYWGLREGWIRKTCHHKEKAQDLTEA